jgi:hypothetical protein
MLRCAGAGYVDEQSVVRLAPRAVALRYARSHLVPDFLAVFPFEAAGRAVVGARGGDALVLKLLALPRLLRVTRLTRKAAALAAADGLRVAKLALAFLLLGHWVGCFWYFLGRWQVEHNGCAHACRCAACARMQLR